MHTRHLRICILALAAAAALAGAILIAMPGACMLLGVPFAVPAPVALPSPVSISVSVPAPVPLTIAILPALLSSSIPLAASMMP